jgi:hypothetical protein
VDASCAPAAAAASADLSAEVAASEVAGDKAALPLFLQYVNAGKQARALELVGCLNGVKSIEGETSLCS